MQKERLKPGQQSKYKIMTTRIEKNVIQFFPDTKKERKVIFKLLNILISDNNEKKMLGNAFLEIGSTPDSLILNIIPDDII